MTISNTTIWEVRGGGSDNNGAGFNASGTSPGTDYSQQDAAQASFTGTVHTTTTQINVVGHTVSSADNRNIIKILTGTATAGYYEITATDVVNNRWTLDRSAGAAAATILSASLGGAAATLNGIQSIVATTSCKTIYFQGTITHTTGSSLSLATSTLPAQLIGYTSIRGDNGQAIIQSGANSVTLISLASTAHYFVSNITFRKVSTHTGIIGLSSSSTCAIVADNCLFEDMVTGCSIGGTRGGVIINCKASGCTTTGFINTRNSVYINAEAYSCGNGFAPGAGDGTTVISNCTSNNNTIGIASTGSNVIIERSIFYNNSSHGISITSGGTQVHEIFNCIFMNNGGYGITSDGSAGNRHKAFYCAFYNNTSGATHANIDASNNTNLTSSPFINPSVNNFNLNNIIGGGKDCLGTGYPINLYYSTNTLPKNNIGIGASLSEKKKDIFSSFLQRY